MFQITFEGDETLLHHLAMIQEGLTDLHVPTQDALIVMAAGVRGNLEDLLDIRPESRAQRKSKPDGAPLDDTGEMIAAATATVDGHANSEYQLAPDGLAGQIGVDGDFHGARRHQFGFGTDKLGRHFDEPARAFMVMEGADVTKVVEIYDRHLVALLETR